MLRLDAALHQCGTAAANVYQRYREFHLFDTHLHEQILTTIQLKFR